jgi:predicted GIY-YIG superfamily endonuclease
LAHLSLRDAERRFDVTRPTLSKALKNGKISGRRNARGHWEVDVAELARVYEARVQAHGEGTDDFATRHTPEAVKAHPEAQAEIEALKRELAVAQALAEERGRLLDQTVKLLTDQRDRASWWKRLIGKG